MGNSNAIYGRLSITIEYQRVSDCETILDHSGSKLQLNYLRVILNSAWVHLAIPECSASFAQIANLIRFVTSVEASWGDETIFGIRS